jgi:hypothetical protein
LPSAIRGCEDRHPTVRSSARMHAARHLQHRVLSQAVKAKRASASRAPPPVAHGVQSVERVSRHDLR